MRKHIFGRMLSALAASLLSVTTLLAQTGQVDGTVTDQSGLPLVGVSVMVDGTMNGTLTDVDGRYSLPDVPSDGVLQFSCIGYVTRNASVGGRSRIDMTLDEDVEMLEETVVIGYGTIKKSDLTGAVSVVDDETFKKRTVTSIGDALQGAAAGVMVRSGGDMGGLPSIQIRGTGNLTNVDPLYIIDGVPTDNNVGFNVNDIESVQILKDASAAAIYGSRAANGVIIITTKSGQEGKTKVEFGAQVSLQHLPQLDLIGGDDWRTLRTQEYELGQKFGTTTEATPQWWDNDVDWQDEFGRQGLLQEYDVAISGGSKASKYRISFGYLDNSGYYIGQSMDRFTTSANSSFTLGRFTFGESLQMGKTDFKTHPLANFGAVLLDNPTMPVHDDVYGKNGWGYGNRTYCYTNGHNVVAEASDENSSTNQEILYMRGSFWTDVRIFDWLKYRLNLGYTLNDSDSHSWSTGYSYAYGETDVASNASASAYRSQTYLVENTLNVAKSFGKHNIAGVLGQSWQDSHYRDLSSGSQDLVKSAGGTYIKNVSGGTTTVPGTGTSTQHRLISYFGRVNYDYDGKYLAQATVRRDGTSRFGPEQRWGTFPSFSAGWRISKEEFFDIPWMNDLKLRANYGTLGSQNVGNYDYQSVVNSYCGYQLSGGDALTPGQAITDIANSDISWEKKTTANIGLDMAFLDNRLQASFEWYDSESKDVLYSQPILKSVGSTTNPVVNSASISNKGVELTLTYSDKIGRDWLWSVGLNLSHNKNKLKKLGYGIDSYDNGEVTLSKIGYPIGMFSLVKTDGLYQTDEEAQADGLISNAHAGDIKFIDYNGDGTITNADRQLLTDKSPWPKLEMGLNINVSYKNWGLQVSGFGQLGKWVFNGPRVMYEGQAGLNQVSTAYFRNVWSETNKHNDVRYPRTAWGYTMNDIVYSDRWLERGDFFKFSTISLSYDYVPTGFLKTVMESARIYVTSQNLLCLTGYSGLDPDFVAVDLFSPGVDPINEYMRHLNYNPVSFILGVNITF